MCVCDDRISGLNNVTDVHVNAVCALGCILVDGRVTEMRAD